jgi:hypothetical protein
LRAALFVLFAVACGDNAATPDALVADAIDAAPDTPPPPAGCDWGELFDTANDPMPETTNLALATQLVMCGAVDVGHAVSTTMLVDNDAFGFSLASETAIRVELEGMFDPLRVELAITNRFGDPITTTRFIGAHAIAAAKLPAGSYGIAVRALGAEPAAAIAYKATITRDTSSCTASAVAYTESAAANDVVEVRYTGELAMRRVLTAAADAPEATGLVFAPGAKQKLAGTSSDVDAPDDFRDRDTFAITTNAATDTLTVSVAWASSLDLDVLVFEADTLPEIAGATRVSTSAPESTTFAVAANTTYWIWIGAYDTSSNLPAAYDVTLCAE